MNEISFGFRSKPKQVQEKYPFPHLILKDSKKNTFVLSKNVCEFFEYSKGEDILRIAVGTVDGKIALIDTTNNPMNNSSIECHIHKTTGNSFNFKKLKDKLNKIFPNNNGEFILELASTNNNLNYAVISEAVLEGEEVFLEENPVYVDEIEAEELSNLEEEIQEVNTNIEEEIQKVILEEIEIEDKKKETETEQRINNKITF